MPPKRLVTFTIGSPSVFQTAPPHPASNARITCSPVFVGGADASQNGLGLLMPAKSMLRSAISPSPFGAALGLVPLVPLGVHRARGVATVRDRVHDLFAAVYAIAA